MQPVGIGVVGAGGFGAFAMSAFREMPEVRVVAVQDADPARARAAAEAYGAKFCETYEDLLAVPEVDVVYLATPPAHHGPAALRALEAGRHVWVEKPFALTPEEAEAVMRLARERGLRVGTNYVLRFNPIYRLARELLQSGVLGELREMTLENCATDEPLPPDHWFWDLQVSGGIFVEHGVHFFDIAGVLSGAQGEWTYSQVWARPPRGNLDRVLAVTRYGSIPAVFYHSFDRPYRVERTEFRLACDLGDITVHGWMPLALTLEGAVDREGLARLEEVAARPALEMGSGRRAPVQATLAFLDGYEGEARRCQGRWMDREVTHRVRLTLACREEKMVVYGRAIQAGAADFARAVRDPGYQPAVTPEAILASLRIAHDAATRAVRLV
ncbi:MAG: Gfo/Idh/MocA family oxidoreductase [Firmicutes bacterium]|nr:Gfo/Idh/MocA family oxidoreductase [Bacillota bacterium]